MTIKDPLFAIYIHWPFCTSKCPYCDFNSHVRQNVDQKNWQVALLTELNTLAQQTGDQTVTSVFFGGGTPSLMAPETVKALIAEVHTLWNVKSNLEITLEANPTSVEKEKFSAFAAAGVNRLSLGIQSLKDDRLKFLGRRHSAAEALKALEIAKQFFPRYSFDLIYALPHQSVKEWQDELEEALSYAGSHLSLYQLTIEEGTWFHTAHQRGDFVLPNDEQAGEFYECTQSLTAQAGLPAYEISNHAAAGQECLHNLTYWRYDDYGGIGPGAHGRLTFDHQKYATRCIRGPETWLDSVNAHGHGMAEKILVTPQEIVTEILLMGLRLKEGICLEGFQHKTGRSLSSTLSEKTLDHLCKEGFLVIDEKRLWATPEGQQRLNSVLAYLLKPSLP